MGSTGKTSANAAARTAPISGTTPARARARHDFGALAQTYRSLPMANKGGWQTIANAVNDAQKRAGKQRLTPGNIFLALNSARLACGWAVATDAPTDLQSPPCLPALAVHAGETGETFSLTLSSDGYAHAVCFLASAPTPAGKATFPDHSFQPLGAVPHLTADTPTDITDLYVSVFGTPEAGAQIALKLVAVSPNGVRAAPILLTCPVAAPVPSAVFFTSAHGVRPKLLAQKKADILKDARLSEMTIADAAHRASVCK